jgi:Ca-activated chloride channel homolog
VKAFSIKISAIFLGIACAAAKAQAPVFQSQTKVVLVDAVVTGKKGEYVRNLTAKDFRVWEDNKEQTIKSLSVATDSAAEPRRLVLFFDNTGMSAADQARVRQAAASFVDTYAGPNRLMAVMNLDEGLRVVQSFIENAGRLKEAVRGVRVTASSSGIAPRETAMGTAEANARNLIQSLGSLARNLNAVPGRKIIVLFAGGASFVAARQTDVTSLVQISNQSNVALYPVAQGLVVQSPSGAEFDVGQQPQPGTYPSPNRIKGGSGDVAGRPDDSTPFTIASGTGGLVLSSSNDLLAQLQKIGEEQNQSYVLGYTPPDSKEGTCHTLRVKVDRSGTEVRSRSSYCTAKPQDLLAESRVEQDLEKRVAGAGTGIAASIQAPFFYAASNVARVHVAMEIATDALKFENQKGKLHAEMNILGIASAPDGGVAARFSDIVKRDFDSKQDLDKWLEQGKAKPLHYEKEFKIVPGQYNLTVAFSSGGASFGKVETPLAVPAYYRSQFAISGLALSKEVRPASELGLEASLIDDGTPLIAGGMQMIPGGSNAFTKSEQAFCYFEIYAPGGADPATVALRILESKTGAPRWDGGAAKLDPPAGGKTTIPVGLSLPIASLPSGPYQLEVTATDGGGKTIERTIDFEIR